MMDPYTYLAALKLTRRPWLGGQDLLLPDIVSALASARSVWLPFRASHSLIDVLGESARVRADDSVRAEVTLPDIGSWHGAYEAVYFGTPTFVKGKPMDPAFREWSVEKERRIVRAISRAGFRLVVAGLGSGSISLRDRLNDMGDGAHVVCEKDFGMFKDWLIVKEAA